jgi:hypothetical protein
MIRMVFEILLLFLLPTLIYAAYVFLLRPRGTAEQGPMFNDAPLLWLLGGAGLALVVIGLLVFGGTPGGRPGQPYDPTVGRTGPSEPGRIK